MPSKSEIAVSKRAPFASFVYVDAAFGSADTDLIIEHTMTVRDTDAIRWLIVKNDTKGVVYREAGTPPRAWGEGYVVLRCSEANANVRVLLFVEQG